MPIVSQEFEVTNTNDPADNVIQEGRRAMYLDMLLSEYYGKMVRQGNSFCINGIQASLRPDPGSSGIDVGLSVEVGVDYVPTTHHSKQAWNNLYKGWRTQKRISSAVGSQVRYDDLEFGWSPGEGTDRGRTSIIYGSGMADTLAEKMVLTGSSTPTAGVTVGNYSMQDYYNSAYETPDASRDPFTNTDIKEAKWGATPFPEVQTIRTSATSSADEFDAFGSNQLQGAMTIGDWQNLPTDQHSLCGVLYISAFCMPDDTAAQTQDTFILTLSISVKSWKPLIFRAKKSRYRGASKGRRFKSRKGKGRYYGRRKR